MVTGFDFAVSVQVILSVCVCVCVRVRASGIEGWYAGEPDSPAFPRCQQTKIRRHRSP